MYKITLFLLVFVNINAFSKEITQKDKELIFKKADDIMLKIATYGQRKPNLTVKKALTSKQGVKLYLDVELKKQYKGNQFLAEEQVLKLMGLINHDIDYEKAIKNVLSKEVAGYYNPKNNTMYIADWLPLSQQEIVLAHELFHAVQRQNYPAMEKMMDEDNSNSDSKLAISSILEGEATAIMLDYEGVIKRKSNMSFDKIPALEFFFNMSMAMNPSQSFKKYSKYPQIMMGIMIFPYIKGLIFLKYFKQHGGWKAIDNVYKRLPLSTEQIIHVDKYLANEKPIIITLDNKENILSGCKYIDKSMFGEAFLYTIFKNDMLNKTNIEDAEGWNGDKIFIYKCDNQYSAVFISEWDTPKDAKEFFRAIKYFFKDSTSGKLIKNQKRMFKIKKAKNKYYVAKIKNKKVVVFLNINKELLKKLPNF